jgi:hypothetical protein
MQRMLGLCAAVALCLFAASPASAQCQPGWGLCPGGGCAPLGAVCCYNYRWCPGGHICTREGSCLRLSDPRVCRNGNYCYPGEYCGGNNRCYRY